VDESRKIVFISCGQYADEERKLGKQVCEMVAKFTPFEGYFAENQASLKSLAENVLRRLYESVGLIVIMHHRGKIDGRDITRASVWIEQEVAIATFMEQVLRRPLHVALFAQPGTTIEGIRQHIQFNAVPFTTSEEVIARLQEMLPKWKEPLYTGDEERRKMVNSVLLTITTSNGHQRNYTIQVENHSEFAVEIERICLWSKGQKISKPVFRPEGAPWSVRARGFLPIQLDAGDDVAQRLWRRAGSPPVIRPIPGFLGPPPGEFEAEVRVVLQCEVLGLEKEFEESRTIKVDFVNRQINAL